jgi:nitroimidazol reductase NimA-like FMN-containing flavoprotein (pyridoxamine 5'-phosphate oxidase superfamily)
MTPAHTYDGGLALADPAAGGVPLDSADAMRLLATVSYGRVVFTIDALPAIRPVNHVLDQGQVIIRTRLSSAVATVADTWVVVAYEADQLDPDTRTGWSVVITGRAHTVTDPERVERYEQLIEPWVNRADTVLAIHPDIVSGLLIGKGAAAGG